MVPGVLQAAQEALLAVLARVQADYPLETAQRVTRPLAALQDSMAAALLRDLRWLGHKREVTANESSWHRVESR